RGEVFRGIHLVVSLRFENTQRSLQACRVVRMNGDHDPTFLNSLCQPPASIFWNADSSQLSRAARKSPDNAADCRSTESPNDRTGECERPENRRSKNGQACECAKRTTDKTAFLGVVDDILLHGENA